MSQTPWWDANALEQFFSQRLLVANVVILNAEKLSGGAIQENWSLTLQIEGTTKTTVVLRCDSATQVAESRSRHEEFLLLQVAHEAGVRVPKPLWFGDESLGRHFFVMEHASGIAHGHQLAKDDRLVPDRAALAAQIGREMAKLHSIATSEPRLNFLPQSRQQPSQISLDSFSSYLDSQSSTYPALRWSIRWLTQKQPLRQSEVLTHRDLRTGNYLVNNGELSAILDWEFASWSDPHEDIGWFCAACWRFGRPEQEAGGIGPRAALYAGYAEVAGWSPDPETVHYWEVFAHLRWAIIALQQAERVTKGGSSSLELALTAHIVPKLERTLLGLTGLTEPKSAGTKTASLSPYRIQPDASELLKLARDTLLTQLLPTLSKAEHYNARMIANAMQIARTQLLQSTERNIDLNALTQAILAGNLDDNHPEAFVGRELLWSIQ